MKLDDRTPRPLPQPKAAPPVAAARDTIAVGLCTYKRLGYLARTLRHVQEACDALGSPVQLIVVDNDGTDPRVRAAVEAFRGLDGLGVHFCVESVPGIAAARNAVFAKADALGVRYLAMLDDDEWPERQWLVELMAERARSRAVVVGGPVRPHFPPSAVHLERWARYWSVERQWLGGKPFVFCTCNFLIDLHAIRSEDRPLFDQEFGLSGGEDVVFFRRLFFAGYPMSWSERAQVREEVPEERASLAWVRRRRYGGGVNAVHWERLDGPLHTLFKTIGLTLRLAVYPLTGREAGSTWMGWLLEAEKVRGRLAAHLGRTVRQYGSDPSGCR